MRRWSQWLAAALVLTLGSCKTMEKGSSSTKATSGVALNDFCTGPNATDEAKELADAVTNYYNFYSGKMQFGQNIPNYPRGAAVTIVKGGGLHVLCNFGLADREKKTPVTENTLFPIGSGSKGFTGIASVKIYDKYKGQGLERPDRLHVKDYMPEYRLFYPHLTEEMTIADLMTHRTGMIPHDSMFYLTTYNRQQILNRLRFLRTIKDGAGSFFFNQDPPGGFRHAGDFHYNNIAFMVAGETLARITKRQNWEQVIKEEFYQPLGMSHSYFLADRKNPDVESKVAKGYSWGVENNQLVSYQVNQTNPGLIEVGPAAAVMTTPLDISRWLLFLASKGEIDGKRLMSAESFDLALQDYHRYKGGNKGVGFGWVEFNQKYPSIQGHEEVQHIYHWGIVEGYSMQINYVPDENIAVSVMTNEAGDRGFIFNMIHNTYRAMWLGGQPQPEQFYDDPKEMEAAKNSMDPDNMAQGSVDTANEGSFFNMINLCRFKDIKGPNYNESGRGLAGEYFNPAYGALKVEQDGDKVVVKFHNQVWPLMPWPWPEGKPYQPDNKVAYFSVPVALQSSRAPAPICFSHDGSQGVPNKIRLVLESPYLPIEFLRDTVFSQNWNKYADLFNTFPDEGNGGGGPGGTALAGDLLNSIPWSVDEAEANHSQEIVKGNYKFAVNSLDPKVVGFLPVLASNVNASVAGNIGTVTGNCIAASGPAAAGCIGSGTTGAIFSGALGFMNTYGASAAKAGEP
ncbi:MAG: serine hydrolase domain-containing protein [Oligoflexales bacterium]